MNPTFTRQLDGNYIVYLEGRRVGTIKRVTCGSTVGYQYFPKGQKTGGEIFTSSAACKQSLMVPE